MAKAKKNKKSKGFLAAAGSLLGSIPAVGSVKKAAKKVKQATKKTVQKVKKVTKIAKKTVKKTVNKKKKQLKANLKKAKKKVKKAKKKAKKKIGKVFTKARKLKNNLSPKQQIKKLKKNMKKAVLNGKKIAKKAKSAVTKASKTVVKATKKVMKKTVLLAKGLNAREVASAVVDFIPLVGNAKAAYESLVGKDPITGRKLEDWERVAAGAAIVGGAVVKGAVRVGKVASAVAGGSKIVKKLTKPAAIPVKPKAPTKAGQKTSGANVEDDILVDAYKNLRKNNDIPGQAHHLNQDAAFRDYIPKNEGLSIKLEGNILKDVGSPHYNAHESLEGFWDVYRKKGELAGLKPNLSEYNGALKDSLIKAGLSEVQASKAVSEAIKQQIKAGLLADDFIPRIPGKINLPKPKA